MIKRYQIEKLKYNLKLAIRRMLPDFFLQLIRRRQVPLEKMQAFLAEHRPLTGLAPKFETLAIVVPCYRHDRYLANTFASIISQTRPPDEVIFIDDRSPNNTGVLLKKLVADYTQSDPGKIKFSIITNDRNLGQALSLNRGITLAQTDLVMILNDDDYLMHDAIETMFGFFKRYPELAMVGGDMTMFTNDDFLDRSEKMIKNIHDPANIKLDITYPADALKFEDFCCLHITHSGSTFVKKKAEAAGLYREKKERIVHFSDRDFQIRLNLLYPVGTTAELPFCFWRSDSSVDSGVNS